MHLFHTEGSVAMGELNFASASVLLAMTVMVAQLEAMRTRTVRLFFVVTYYMMFVVTSILRTIVHIFYNHVVPLQYLSESFLNERQRFPFLEFGFNCWMMVGIMISFMSIKFKDEH